MNSGMLFAVPIPGEHSMDPLVVEEAINQAIKMSNEKGIHGKETTPFLLETVKKITNNKSLQASILIILKLLDMSRDPVSDLIIFFIKLYRCGADKK